MPRFIVLVVVSVLLGTRVDAAPLQLNLFSQGGMLAMQLTGSGVSSGGANSASFDLLVPSAFFGPNFDAVAFQSSLKYNSQPAFGELTNMTLADSQLITSIGFVGSTAPDLQERDRIRINLLTQHVFSNGHSWQIVNNTTFVSDSPYDGLFVEGTYSTSAAELGLGAATVVVGPSVPEPAALSLLGLVVCIAGRRRS